MTGRVAASEPEAGPVEVYLVASPSRRTEADDVVRVLDGAVFARMEDAEAVARERGGYALVVPLYRDTVPYRDEERRKLRGQALRKLTAEEREALGLSPDGGG